MSVEKEITACNRKTRYPNKEIAQRMAHSQMKRNPKIPDLRPYYCEWCHGYHLTHRPG